jgi:hypothetical protein
MPTGAEKKEIASPSEYYLHPACLRAKVGLEYQKANEELQDAPSIDSNKIPACGGFSRKSNGSCCSRTVAIESHQAATWF